MIKALFPVAFIPAIEKLGADTFPEFVTVSLFVPPANKYKSSVGDVSKPAPIPLFALLNDSTP